MSNPRSFADKLRAGWSKADLMKYYCLSEEQYNRVTESLKRIQQVRKRRQI